MGDRVKSYTDREWGDAGSDYSVVVIERDIAFDYKCESCHSQNDAVGIITKKRRVSSEGGRAYSDAIAISTIELDEAVHDIKSSIRKIVRHDVIINPICVDCMHHQSWAVLINRLAKNTFLRVMLPFISMSMLNSHLRKISPEERPNFTDRAG